MYSKRLQRQIAKAWKSWDENSQASALALLKSLPETEQSKTLIDFFEKFPAFLVSIDTAYSQLDDRVNLSTQSLEISSRELSETNTALFRMHAEVDAMLNSLGQGFLMFDSTGLCQATYSKVCEDLLECVPAGRPIDDVLKIPHEKRASFKGWIQLLFTEATDFLELAAVGPSFYPHSKGKSVRLQFLPRRGVDGQIVAILVVATDETDSVRSREQLNDLRNRNRLLTAIMNDRNQVVATLAYLNSLIGQATSLARSPSPSVALSQIRFVLHTIKSSAGVIGLEGLRECVHGIEAKLEATPRDEKALGYVEKSLRDVQEALVQETAIYSDIFDKLHVERGAMREIELQALTAFENELRAAKSPLADLFARTFVEKPVAEVFERYRAILAETADKLGRPVPSLRIDADDVRMMPERHESLLQSFNHLFKNIIYHGIEDPAARERAGKPAMGHVDVEIRCVSSADKRVCIVKISDDGRGLSADRLNAPPGTDPHDLIFRNGVSSERSVNVHAGRGVGLGAVRQEIEAIGGRITASSVPGKGMTFTLEIPMEAKTSSAGKSERRAG